MDPRASFDQTVAFVEAEDADEEKEVCLVEVMP